jgi:hypothetical protein
MIKTNQYRGFDEYFKISDFDSETQVFAEQSLLNDEEKLPNEMQKWVEQIEPENNQLIFLPFLNGSNVAPLAKARPLRSCWPRGNKQNRHCAGRYTAQCRSFFNFFQN